MSQVDVFRNLVVVGIIMLFSFGETQAHEYECRKANGHVIHILNIPASEYALSLVKAHDQVFGRETIDSMAMRSGADIAINAGFFEIGHHDGMPSGTLIIDGKIFGFISNKNACLIKRDDQLSIKSINHPLVLNIAGKAVSINKVNKFPDKNDCVLYTSLWGRNTLTPKGNRKEIVFDENRNFIGAMDHGSSPIPHDGFVISLPKTHSLNIENISPDFTLDLIEIMPLSAPDCSVVTGIPILMQDGVINGDVLKSKNHFYATPHARTAFGLKKNGDMVIVVAEHHYAKPLTDITLGEVKELISSNKLKLLAKYRKSPADLSLNELKDIVKQEYSKKGDVVGLTLPELAKLLQKLGCESAINFDGGGSSSLWMDGKVINTTFGDTDEALGQLTLRPIADAIVFKKKG